MTTESSDPVIRRQKLALLASLLVVLCGLLVLAGWAFDIPALKSILPIWVSMKANTALCFVLLGIALLLSIRPPDNVNPEFSGMRRHIAQLCGLLAGLVGLLTLGEYVFDCNLGIDQWLFREADGMPGTPHPGRMAPETALNFALLSIAILLNNIREKSRWFMIMSAIICMLVMGFTLAALLAYLTPQLGDFGWFGLTVMAAHTGALFVLLSLIIAVTCWQKDVLSWSLGNNVTLAFAAGMLLLVIMGLNASRTQYLLRDLSQDIANAEKVQGIIASIMASTIHAQSRSRGFVITGDEWFLQRHASVRTDIDTNLTTLRQLTILSDNPNSRGYFARIDAWVKPLLQWQQKVITARKARAGFTDATRDQMIRHGAELLDNLLAAYSQIQGEQNQDISRLNQQAKRLYQYNYLIIFGSTLLSLTIFLIVIIRLNISEKERKQAYIRLQQSQDSLIRSEKHAALGVLVGGVAHEINNPLMGISGYISYVRDNIKEEKLRGLLDNAQRELERIGRLVKSMLAFGRQSTHAESSANVAETMDNLLQVIKGDFAMADIQCTVDIPDGLPSVAISRDALQQILLNLLLNARDALREQPQPREVQVAAHVAETPSGQPVVVLSVSDNGQGVPAEIGNKIFDPFFTTKAPGKGTGLGLPISMQLAEAAGGSLELASIVKGACLLLKLPVKEQKNKGDVT